MGFMKLLEAAVKTVVVLPVAIVKDVTGYTPLVEGKSAVAETLKDIKEDIDEIAE